MPKKKAVVKKGKAKGKKKAAAKVETTSVSDAAPVVCQTCADFKAGFREDRPCGHTD